MGSARWKKRSAVGALAMAGVLIGTLTTTGAADAQGRLTKGVDIDRHITVGDTVTLDSHFVVPANVRVVLDTEVYDSRNKIVVEWDAVVESPHRDRVTKSYEWKTTGLPAGEYVVKQGVFTPGWTRAYDWNDRAARVRVVTTTKPPVTTPTTKPPVTTPTTKPPVTTPTTKPPVTTPTTTPPTTPPTTTPPTTGGDLRNNATLKARAAMITSSFENSDLRIDYGYAENIGDGRGITAGRAGFTSGTSDLLELVTNYTAMVPSNGLAKYLPALRQVNGSASTSGLSGFEAAFRAEDAGQNRAKFRQAQDALAEKLYLHPAIALADAAGIKSPLGQAILWDTAIHHGLSQEYQIGQTVNWNSIGSGDSMDEVLKEARTAMGGNVNGNEAAWLRKFLDIRLVHLLNWSEEGDQFDDSSQSRVDALRSIVAAGKLDLSPTFSWTAYGDRFTIDGVIQGQQFND